MSLQQPTGYLGENPVVRHREKKAAYRLRVETLMGGALGHSGPDMGWEASEIESSSFPRALGSAGPVGQRKAEPCSPQTTVTFQTPTLVLGPPSSLLFPQEAVALLSLPISHYSQA